MSEFKTISRHAGTVLVGQIAIMAYGVTDTIVAGRYSEQSLAALSVGAAIYISVFVSLSGLLQAMLPIWSELRGARRDDELGRSVRQSLYLCALATVLGLAVLLSPAPIMRWTEVPEALRSEIERYLAVLALVLPPSLLFRVYSTLNQSLGKPLLVTWLQIGSLALKVPLSMWFAFGGFGLEPHGAVGCAWATLVVTYLMLAVAVWTLRTQPVYRSYRIWERMEAPHWPSLRGFLHLGVPSGLAVLVEVTSFTLMALFIARLGTVASASHQIASNVAAVLYMVPLSIAIAASARVSYWLGAGEPLRARATIATGFRLAVLAMLGLCAALLLARSGLASLYAKQPAVASLATQLLACVALYHAADAVQALCVFILRCYRVSASLLVVYCALLWGLGLGGGIALAYRGTPWSEPLHTPVAFWLASALALWFTAAIFVAILLYVLRRSTPAPAPGARPLPSA